MINGPGLPTPFLQVIKNWTVGWPGNEASLTGSHTASKQGISIGTYMYTWEEDVGVPLQVAAPVAILFL